MFGEASPRTLHQTYVAGDVQLVADEGTRKAMIDARRKFLDGRPNIATHNAPSASPGVVTPDPKIQTDMPIASTTAPEDPYVTRMRSFENGTPGDQAITR
jgi:hypothetical protein